LSPLLTVTMAMVVVMRMATHIRRHVGDVAVAHAALGNDVIRKCLHLGAPALEHRDFEAAVVVEMNMQRRLGEIVMRMEVPGVRRLGSSRSPWS